MGFGEKVRLAGMESVRKKLKTHDNLTELPKLGGLGAGRKWTLFTVHLDFKRVTGSKLS